MSNTVQNEVLRQNFAGLELVHTGEEDKLNKNEMKVNKMPALLQSCFCYDVIFRAGEILISTDRLFSFSVVVLSRYT